VRASAAFTRETRRHGLTAAGHRDEARRLTGTPRAPRAAQSHRHGVAARKGWEKRKERDECVESNLPPHLVPLWEKVKHGRAFTGVTCDRATELFFEYVEAHPKEASRAYIDEADARLEREIKEYESAPQSDEDAEYEAELAAEREAMKDNPGKKTPMAAKKARARKGRAVAVNPSLHPDLYQRTFVAELVGNVAKELGTIAQELRDGASPKTLLGRIDANMATLLAVSEGIRGGTVKSNPSAPPTYKSSHWGIDSKKDLSLLVPTPHKSHPMVGLGELVSVVYLTQKGGDGGLTEYEHKFEKRRPVLAYALDKGRTRLFVAGGSYTVTRRGIVG
jgi:hypothetical protein